MEQGLAFWAAVLTIAGLLATAYMVEYRQGTEIESVPFQEYK